MTGNGTRTPRAFDPQDPALASRENDAATDEAAGEAVAPPGASPPPGPTGVSWTGVLLSSLASLVLLALGVQAADFVATAVRRDDWVGWFASGLLAAAAIAFLVIVAREIAGLIRLRRLAAVRKAMDEVVEGRSPDEKAAVARLRSLYAARGDMRWGLARLADHERDVRDPGDLARLAERELVAPLDIRVRGAILAAAKRVGVVTALSPSGFLSVGYVLYENLRLLRTVARLYGGRPGALGALRLARLVATHIVATGGLAFTDDLLGQFLGQDLLRRASARLGEGAFNGALTARVGVAAVEVCRPMPFVETAPVRVRNLVPELFRGMVRRSGADAEPDHAARGRPPGASA